MNRVNWAIVVVLLMICGEAVADTLTGAFVSRFRTLEVHVEGNELSPPIADFANGDRIIVEWDELAEERSYLRYRLVHCDYNWNPSGLVESEFLDGFNEAEVVDWDYSQATTVHYIHYSVALPNEHMLPKISGNYLMQVYDESDPDKVLLQVRFSVAESVVDIRAEVSSRTDIDYNASNQQLSVSVDVKQEKVHDIYNDLKVVVTQNGRVDNELVVSRPLRVSGNVAYFEHLRPMIFAAGNEYRRFETVSTVYPGMKIAEISYNEPYYHMTVSEDYPRYADNYAYDRTQHGRFKIREYNYDEGSDLAADYIMTHFTLKMPRDDNFDFFIDGDLTCRRFSPETRLHYNYNTEAYEATLLLKQGSYNYQYLAVPVGGDKGVTGVVEGDFYQTINEYVVKVYYRHPGERYDRLLGVTAVYSGE